MNQELNKISNVVSNFFNRVTWILVSLIVIISLGVSKPSLDDHKLKIKSVISKVSGVGIIDNTIGKLFSGIDLITYEFEVKDGVILSVGVINHDLNPNTPKKPISLGVCGKVFIFPGNLP